MHLVSVARLSTLSTLSAFVALADIACAASSPPPSPPLAASVASTSASASTIVVASAPTAQEIVYEAAEPGSGIPIVALDAENVPVAPCFGDRVYRGKVGPVRITLVLKTEGDRLTGRYHLDDGARPGRVNGMRSGDAFKLDESVARFEGACDPATGKLVGTYTERGAVTTIERRQSFVLSPRPAVEAAIYEVTASPAANERSHLGQLTERSRARQLRDRSPARSDGACLYDVRVPRFLDLPDPTDTSLTVHDTANRLEAVLDHEGQDYASPDTFHRVQKCARGDEIRASGGFSVRFNAHGVVSLYRTGTLSGPVEAHAGAFGPDTFVVDLFTGKKLALGDLVTDEAAFRAAVLPCAEQLRDELDWGTEDSPRREARWIVVGDGIAVVVGPMGPAGYGVQGTGPVASFASLLARGLLRAGSPVARLWKDVTPAARDAPVCNWMVGGGKLLALRRRSAAG